jgi:hypothetical protein
LRRRPGERSRDRADGGSGALPAGVPDSGDHDPHKRHQQDERHPGDLDLDELHPGELDQGSLIKASLIEET